VLDVVQKIRGGDLGARTAVVGRDEIGHLGEALNEMAKGLQDRDRIKEIFGRYVITQVSQELFEQHGILDKFIGDGMLAVFGSLDDTQAHERRAPWSASPPSRSASASTPTTSSSATSAPASAWSTPSLATA
jgi:class 3 adenylate cyclase